MKHLIVLFAFSLVACKPAASTDSSGKSLDNFASSGEARPNQCGYRITASDYEKLSDKARKKMSRIQGGNQQLQLAAASALTAVPKPIQTFFYGAGGRILLSSNAAGECSKADLTAAEREYAGERAQTVACWQERDGGVDVILQADAGVIRHNLVRMFAYVYTQYFVERFDRADLSGDLANKVKKGVARFKAQRNALASGFIADLAKVDAQTRTRLLKLEQADSEAFENMVFAEAIDSYYCSSGTEKVFGKKFGNAHSVFVKGDRNIADDFGVPWYR